jgi:hypothetical protein
MSENKQIDISIYLTPKKEQKNEIREPEQKIPQNRVVVDKPTWVLEDIDYNPYFQLAALFGEDDPEKDNINHFNKIRELARQQIMCKIHGYHAQDVKKHKYNTDEFIDLKHVMDLLQKCELNCYYCRKPTQVLYKHVREPCQWTLDRINNDIGHNKGNVEIACLSCNLKRRRIYHERFIFTKQLNIVKTG